MSSVLAPDGSDARARIDRVPRRNRPSRREAPRSCRSPATPRTGATSACCFATSRRRCWPSIPARSTFDALPFVNVARLLSAMPVPVPRILAHSDALGIIALEDLGDVTLQAHVGAASPAEHAALYRQAVTLHQHAAAPRPRARVARTYVPYGIALRRREADVGAAVLHEAFPRGVPRRTAQRRRARRRWRASTRRSSRSWRPSRRSSATATTTAAT